MSSHNVKSDETWHKKPQLQKRKFKQAKMHSCGEGNMQAQPKALCTKALIRVNIVSENVVEYDIIYIIVKDFYQVTFRTGYLHMFTSFFNGLEATIAYHRVTISKKN